MIRLWHPNPGAMDDTVSRELGDRLQRAIGDRFEIAGLIGAGGFAAVFRARDLTLDRDVAIKVLDPRIALDEEATRRLLDEARLVAAAEHPHIVPLYEAASRDGITWLVMRHFGHGTVAALLAREGALSPADVARIGAEVADALATAHARGIVHLDLKPDNLLVDAERHAYVADFGIARLLRAGEGQPSGLATGSPHYMSPEQVAGDVVDGRADVYALGLVLWELASGRQAISGGSAQQVMANQIRQLPPALREVAPELPAPLAAAIMRAIAKDPAERWPSAREMADALRQAGESAHLLSPRVVKRKRRRRWFTGIGLAFAGVAGVVVLLVVMLVRVITGMSSGAPPAIDAWAPGIPAPLLDSARTIGALPDSAVRYIYAPHGRGMREALLFTRDSMIVARTGGARRLALEDDIRIDIKREGSRGLLVVTSDGGAVVDTVYDGMSGLEQQVLLLALKRMDPDTSAAAKERE